MPIAKSSGNNRKRIDALRMVLDTIRATPGGLSVAQLNKAMNIADSTGKAYLKELMEGRCITRSQYKPEGQHPYSRYTVCATQAHIFKFLDSLRYCPVPPQKMSQAERMQRDPSRHFHVADDDEPVKVRVPHVRIPAPDPLLAMFYGIAPA